ncbi:MAG: ubiquinol-cytochrome c reductase iron-sulfur subunit [Gammaproteobacteria bacterium]|nr:ubiquinol-cytochrome c reductase iron-sulfur subunit [Gammaproteobacteria bacterium]
MASESETGAPDPGAGSTEARQGSERGRRRRQFLITATSTLGGVGVGAAAVPFIRSWSPSAKARARAAPVQLDISRLRPGELLTATWAGRPVWVLRRTPDMLSALEQPNLLARLRDPESTVDAQQPDYAANPFRSRRPEYLVLVALCTHLGCIPDFRPRPDDGPSGVPWHGGFFCPCHGSMFDLAGRVYKAVPAPTNLVVPRHDYVDAATVEIGRDGAA